VARQTRSERRARRAAQAESRAAVERAPQRPQPQQPRPPAERGERDGHPVPAKQKSHFISESWAELKKVDWPGQHQLVQGTAVVLIACLITGVYLWLADEVFRRFVQHVLLG
jgi:preprotein translocase subunit SecE